MRKTCRYPTAGFLEAHPEIPNIPQSLPRKEPLAQKPGKPEVTNSKCLCSLGRDLETNAFAFYMQTFKKPHRFNFG